MVWGNSEVGVQLEEIRIKDPVSGGEKGQKLARFSLIPQRFLWALAEHYGKGSKKYADRNWEKGYKWSLSLDAHSRHLYLWLMGEDDDEETGSNHLIAAIWHLIALYMYSVVYGRGTDDIRHFDGTDGHGVGVDIDNKMIPKGRDISALYCSSG